VFVSDNRWSESILTWNSKPPAGRAFARWRVWKGQPVEFDVTGFVQEALAADNGCRCASSRPTTSHVESRPQLLLTFVP
jgi:hypothetical protein